MQWREEFRGELPHPQTLPLLAHAKQSGVLILRLPAGEWAQHFLEEGPIEGFAPAANSPARLH